jgi:hypothetical protein
VVATKAPAKGGAVAPGAPGNVAAGAASTADIKTANSRRVQSAKKSAGGMEGSISGELEPSMKLV